MTGEAAAEQGEVGCVRAAAGAMAKDQQGLGPVGVVDQQPGRPLRGGDLDDLGAQSSRSCSGGGADSAGTGTGSSVSDRGRSSEGSLFCTLFTAVDTA